MSSERALSLLWGAHRLPRAVRGVLPGPGRSCLGSTLSLTSPGKPGSLHSGAPWRVHMRGCSFTHSESHMAFLCRNADPGTEFHRMGNSEAFPTGSRKRQSQGRQAQKAFGWRNAKGQLEVGPGLWPRPPQGQVKEGGERGRSGLTRAHEVLSACLVHTVHKGKVFCGPSRGSGGIWCPSGGAMLLLN